MATRHNSTFNMAIDPLVNNRLVNTLSENNSSSRDSSSIMKNKTRSGNSNFPSRPESSDGQESQDSHNMLTMALIGCLSDNVQQAMKSFSIRPRKQYITFAFPFMEDLIRRFGETSSVPEMGCSSEKPHCVTPALLFDQCLEVVHGFQTFVTFAPCMNRESLPIVLLTLYQKDTTEGLQRHFESLVRILLNNKTLLSVWKLPVLVVDLPPKTLDLVADTCASTIMDIQAENLQNTFPGKSLDDLFHLVKEKMIRPYLVSYRDFLATHTQEVMGQLTTTDPHYFHSLVSHLQSVGCSLVDFKKVELFLKSSGSELAMKEFWKVWGHDQVACKVFPVTAATRSFHKLGSLYYSSPLGNGLNISVSTGPLSHVPIKEGLQNIIKCLKSQDVASSDLPDERQERVGMCCCNVCKYHSLSRDHKPIFDSSSHSDFLGSESAFRRPLPGTRFQSDCFSHLGTSSTAYRATSASGSALKTRSLLPYPSLSLTSTSSTNNNSSRLGANKVVSGLSLRTGCSNTGASLADYAGYYAGSASVLHPVPHYFSLEPGSTRFGSSVSSFYYHHRSRVISSPSVFYPESQ